jgi:hypothetical protein
MTFIGSVKRCLQIRIEAHFSGSPILHKVQIQSCEAIVTLMKVLHACNTIMKGSQLPPYYPSWYQTGNSRPHRRMRA